MSNCKNTKGRRGRRHRIGNLARDAREVALGDLRQVLAPRGQRAAGDAAGHPRQLARPLDLVGQAARQELVGRRLAVADHDARRFVGRHAFRRAVVHLNGANSYAGSTAVTGTGSPKLFVNGTKTGTGTITVDSVGTLGGSGSVAGNITNSGTISPGTSIGTLTALGNVTMNANSHLAIELSGGSADKLAVGGNLNLATVDFLDITGVGQGLSWVIATYTGTLTGTFNNVTPGYSVNYGTGTNSQITLNKAATGVNGDFNNDGTVDAGDYLVWRKNNGTNNVLLNSNGLSTPVGSAQYNLWRSNFGKPPGSSSGDLEGATIPEPTSLWMVLVALISLGTTCRRR